MVDSVNNSASLYVSGVKNLKFKYTIYWINFRKNSKRPSTPPHFRKIMLQIVFGKRPKKTLFKGQIIRLFSKDENGANHDWIKSCTIFYDFFIVLGVTE